MRYGLSINAIKRCIVNSSYTMIMVNDLSLRINHAIQRDIASTSHAVNMLSDVPPRLICKLRTQIEVLTRIETN